jgi:hypothetical protein
LEAGTGVVYLVLSSGGKDSPILVRQLRGPHLRTWPWRRAVEHGGDRGSIAEDLAPILHRAVGSEERAGALVASHDEFQEVLGCRRRELADAEVVDDEAVLIEFPPDALFRKR